MNACEYTQTLHSHFLHPWWSVLVSGIAIAALIYAGFKQDQLNDCCRYDNLPKFYRVLSRLRFVTIWCLLVANFISFMLELSLGYYQSMACHFPPGTVLLEPVIIRFADKDLGDVLRLVSDALLAAAAVYAALWVHVRSKHQECLLTWYSETGVEPSHDHWWQFGAERRRHGGDRRVQPDRRQQGRRSSDQQICHNCGAEQKNGEV